MKSTVIIVHGWEADPTSNWFPWLKSVLEEEGHTCLVLSMPNSARPVLAEWVEHLRQAAARVPAGGKIIFIGHSLGCVTIAHYLDRVKEARADGCVFVAGFSGNIRLQAIKEFYENQVDLEKAKSKIKKSINIISLNDRAVPAESSREFARALGSEIVEVDGYGHFMGSEGVRKLPMILPEIQKLI